MKNTILRYFSDNFGFDEETSLELYNDFLSMVDRFLLDIPEALEEKKFVQPSRIGPTLKGCAPNVGFQTLVDEAVKLETAAQAHDLDVCSQINQTLITSPVTL